MRTITSTLLTCLVALVAVAGSGCGAEDESCCVLEPVDIDPLGLQYRYVIDSVDMPSTPNEVTSFGMVLDCNEQGRPNNAIGQILASVYNLVDVDLDARVQSAVDAGHILHLLEIQATSLDNAAGVGAQIFLGVDRDDDALDNFSGVENFAIEPGHFSQPLAGAMVEGRLAVELGTVPLRIALPHVDTPFTIELEAARIVADVVTASEIRGTIGGVVVEDELHASLLPIICSSLQASVALDCVGGVCEDGSHGEIFLDLFDEDYDGAIGFAEFENNTLVRSLFAPDVDMFDADGNICVGCDGVKDSLSFGAGFSAVPARFTPPQ